MVMKIAPSLGQGTDFSVAKESDQWNVPQFVNSGNLILNHWTECKMTRFAGKQHNSIWPGNLLVEF